MIQKKLFEIQKRRVGVEKSGNNPHFKSAYMTLDSIVNAFNPLFNEFGILCYHTTIDNWVITILHDIESDTKVESIFKILNTDPQKRWAEITYGKRYNLGQLLNIITEYDDDGNSSSWANFQAKKPYTKKCFEALAEAYRDWWSPLAKQAFKEQQEEFEVPIAKITKLAEVYRANRAITQDDIDNLWKSEEDMRKEVKWI